MALTITTASLAEATRGTAYSQTLGASGGTPPYTWTILAGGLPAGLALDGDTGEISGAPTRREHRVFAVRVEDDASPADVGAAAFTLDVSMTGAVAAEGPISLPLAYAVESLAASAAFQSWVGAADAAEAKSFISTVKAEVLVPPLAVVRWAPTWRRSRSSSGTRYYYGQLGEIVILFRSAIEAGMGDDDAAIAFRNLLGNIVKDMEALSGTPWYLAFEDVSFERQPERPRAEEANADVGDFYQAELKFSFAGI